MADGAAHDRASNRHASDAPYAGQCELSLGAAILGFYVDVRLRNFGDRLGAGGRWLAVADIAGEHESPQAV